MHKISNLWKIELNRLSKLQTNNERKKHPCHTKLCAFRWLILRYHILNLRSRNQMRGKLLHFSKNTLPQRELFLTMFYTINLSPLLVIKKVFMMIIITSNYQLCPLPSNQPNFWTVYQTYKTSSIYDAFVATHPVTLEWPSVKVQAVIRFKMEKFGAYSYCSHCFYNL